LGVLEYFIESIVLFIKFFYGFFIKMMFYVNFGGVGVGGFEGVWSVVRK